MCGFLGEVSSNLLDKEFFLDLLNLSLKRPDQQGYWRNDFCQLGFNRLSILDVSENGSQPIISPNQKYALVFNGEVYNYKEIQEKYNIKESELRSFSDSEILAHLIEKVEILDFAKELNGMFSIAVYDFEKKAVHLIRDFAGIKPLYYGVHGEGIVFASQFDQIFMHPAFKDSKKMRPEIMNEYFSLGYMHAPNTIFENIYQVEPAQIISWDLNKMDFFLKSSYYNWTEKSTRNETDDNTISLFENIFNQVVKKQLQSDVPIATFLSGGIDSPLVTAFAKKNKKDIKGFTIGVEDKELNESEVAQLFAKQLEVDHYVEKINEKEIITIIDEHFNSLKEPFGDFSSIPTYLVTKKARKHATVMLSGDGGDELFWGYPRFIKSVEQAKWFVLPVSFRKIFIPILRKIIPNLSFSLENEVFFGDWILHKQTHLKTSSFMPNVPFSKELYKSYRFSKKNSKTNILLYLKENEFYAHLQKVLKKVDLTSMENSVEVRVPFLDKEIIKFSNEINPELGIKHYSPKYILKKALGKKVDDSLINLPKKGFSVPVDKWLRNELREDVQKMLLNEKFYGEENLIKEEFNKVVENFFNEEKNVNAWGIWHLYSWQKWAKKYELI